MPSTVESPSGLLSNEWLPAPQALRRVRRHGRKSRSGRLSELVRITRRLAATEIAYIAHPAFVRRNAAEWIVEQRPATLDHNVVRETASSAHGVAFVAELVRERLLSPPEEVYLFLQMNYLKHRAEVLRRRLKPTRPDRELVDTIQAAMRESAECRNRLVVANSRLVVAVATKLSHSVDMLSELVSEGLVPLIRAVELFDVSRGHRFSTYATWAVRNQMLRVLQRRRNSRERSLADELPGLENFPDTRPAANGHEQRDRQLKSCVKRLLSQLTEREQSVIAARFGLNGHPTGQSLSEIAADLGLSKERVRQIILQTLEKLRGVVDPQVAEEWDIGGEG